MSTPGEDRETAPSEWPAQGLEHLPACPACGDGRRTLLHDGLTDHFAGCAPGRWTLLLCAGCGAAYLNPRPTPDTIHLAYTSYYTHTESVGAGGLRERLRHGYLNARYGYHFTPASRAASLVVPLFPARRRRFEASVRGLRPAGGPARLLDVGCGNGAFLAKMRTQGYDVVGLELDPAAVATARAAGLEVAQGPMTDATFPPRSFDVITLHHVLEHVHDPVALLGRCAGLLREGGRLCIHTPNLDSLAHRRFGASWSELDAPRHLVLFTLRSLRHACEAAGLRVLDAEADLGAFGIAAASEGARAQAGGRSLGRWQGRATNALHDAVLLLWPALGEELVVTCSGPLT